MMLSIMSAFAEERLDKQVKMLSGLIERECEGKYSIPTKIMLGLR